MKKETINPRSLFDARQYGFSQVVTSDPGKLVFISGQVAWDENQNIVGVNNLEVQARKALDNLKLAIAAAGGTLSNIVMLRIYVVNYRPEDGRMISQLLKDTFDNTHLPASTWIHVKGLANEAFMIEIEAQAVI